MGWSMPKIQDLSDNKKEPSVENLQDVSILSNPFKKKESFQIIDQEQEKKRVGPLKVKSVLV